MSTYDYIKGSGLESLLNIRNLLDGNLVKIPQQQGTALLCREFIQHGMDRSPELFLIQGRIRNEFRPVFFHGVEYRVAVLCFIQKNLPALAEISRAFMGGNLLAPGDKSRRLPELIDGLENFHKGILGQIRRQLHILAHILQNIVIYVLVKSIVEFSVSAGLFLPDRGDQSDQSLFFHH